jgi:hypothetical protein
VSNAKWLIGSYPAIYVLDIVTESGDTQMVLSTAYPGGDGSELVQADADATAAALETAVSGLAEVTDVTTTPFTQGETGIITVLFDTTDYANFTFIISLPTEFDSPSSAILISASPSDGMLTSDDLDTVNAAVLTAIEGLDTVTDCTVSQLFVTPGTL